MTEHELVDKRRPGVVEHNNLAIMHEVCGQKIEHLPKPPNLVAIARDQPATNGVSRGATWARTSIRMIERHRLRDRIDQRQHAGRFNHHRTIAQSSLRYAYRLGLAWREQPD